MPKRKAPEVKSATHPDRAVAIASLNPSKKGKKEAIAAAREWHARRDTDKPPGGDTKEAVGSVDAAGPSEEGTAVTAATVSPNPRKKSKKEALSEARQWHDRLNIEKSGGGADQVVGSADADGPIEEGKYAATKSVPTSEQPEKEAAARNSTLTGTVTASSKLNTAQQRSSLFGDVMNVFKEDSFKKNQCSISDGGFGGNVFLQSCRKQNGLEKEVVKQEAPSLDPMNTNEKRPSSTSLRSSCTGVLSSSANASFEKKIDTKSNTANRSLAISEAIIIICLLALNVAGVIFIRDQQISNNSFREEHTLEVEKLKARLAKSHEVKAVLQSGISVFEQHQWEMEDPSKVSAMYNFQFMGQGVDGMLSPEERNDWLEGLRLLTMANELALNDLDEKMVDFGVKGEMRKLGRRNGTEI